MTKVNYVNIYGPIEHGKFFIGKEAVKYEWSGSEQVSLTEMKKEEFEINLINLY